MNKLIYQDSEITKFLIESPKYGNFEILIDTEDWNKIKKYHWGISYNGNFYVKTNIYNKVKDIILILHRIILNTTNPKIKIDHINHNTLDNRKINLRECTNSENCRNTKINKNNTSGYKGVYFSKQDKKWRAMIQKDYQKKHIGFFDNKIDAAKAYNEAALKYFGEFANLNII